MDAMKPTFDGLRAKGHTIDDIYVQAGVAQAGAQHYVVVSGVAMPYRDATALNRGWVSLDEIARYRTR